MLLALRASADEIVLYGRGRDLWPAGVAMFVGGLLLGGFPVGLLHEGSDAIEPTSPVLLAVIVLSSALTGAAVLRAAGRIFAERSGVPGPEMSAPTERERERSGRPLWLMLAPCATLLAIDCIPAALLKPFLSDAAASLVDPLAPVRTQWPVPSHPLVSYMPIGLTVVLFLISLCRQRPTAAISRKLYRAESSAFQALQFVHSGIVCDYAVWMILGLVGMAIAISG
jgi:multicomponent Na+:H+ antiporter subunit D